MTDKLKVKANDIGLTVHDILGEGGALHQILPHYRPRLQQLRMAEHCQKSLRDGKHLIVEAATGCGKSYGYLTPAIASAIVSGKKVIISTGTKHLQKQIIDK